MLASLLCVFTFSTSAYAQHTEIPHDVYSADEYYNQDYLNCLKIARKKTVYVHELMREEALGLKLNECLYDKGWGGYDKDDPEQEELYQNYLRYDY